MPRHLLLGRSPGASHPSDTDRRRRSTKGKQMILADASCGLVKLWPKRSPSNPNASYSLWRVTQGKSSVTFSVNSNVLAFKLPGILFHVTCLFEMPVSIKLTLTPSLTTDGSWEIRLKHFHQIQDVYVSYSQIYLDILPRPNVTLVMRWMLSSRPSQQLSAFGRSLDGNARYELTPIETLYFILHTSSTEKRVSSASTPFTKNIECIRWIGGRFDSWWDKNAGCSSRTAVPKRKWLTGAERWVEEEWRASFDGWLGQPIRCVQTLQCYSYSANDSLKLLKCSKLTSNALKLADSTNLLTTVYCLR